MKTHTYQGKVYQPKEVTMMNERWFPLRVGVLVLIAVLLSLWVLVRPTDDFACKDAELAKEVQNNEEGVEIYFFVGLCWKT